VAQHQRRRPRPRRDFSPRQKVFLALSVAAQLGPASAARADLALRPASQVRGPKYRGALLMAVSHAHPVACVRRSLPRRLGG
jgi:hypothetical protein